jgi:polysaccharide deacetylase family protein (PEP-CTERM system associated)
MRPAPLATGEAGPITHAMSIDVEDWYHSLDPDPANWPAYDHRILASTRKMLDILARTGTRATFFILGPVAEREPGLVAEIHRAGHEIGSHGSEHRMVYGQSPAEFEADVRRSVAALEAATGVAPRGYRAPCFSITKRSLWALDILKGLGFTYDSSIHPVHNPRYGIARAPRLPHLAAPGLIEVPISTFPLGSLNLPCAGGVYFRALPWFLLKRMFRRLEARGERIIFYFHPWELDPGQPRIAAPWPLRMRHYHALGRSAAKFERLCRTFRFGTISEAVGA